MYKLGHQHKFKGPDYGFVGGIKVPAVLTYSVTTWRRWFDFFMFRFGFGLTPVKLRGNCEYTTDPYEPYQPDRAFLTVDGQDLFQILEDQKVKGRVKVVAVIPQSLNSYSRTNMKNADCEIILGFTRKKSAVMAKLALGGA